MKLLVVGSGVAGAAFSQLAANDRHAVTMIEQGPFESPRGYAMNLCPRALDVLRLMGMLDEIWQLRIPIHQLNMLDSAGTQVRCDDLSQLTARDGKLGCYVERGSLLASLRERCTNVDVRYNCRLESIVAGDSEIVVQLSDGSELAFDAVVGADGLHSSVARLAFEPAQPIDLGVSFAFVRAPNLRRLPIATYNLSAPRKLCGLTGLSEEEVGIMLFWYTQDYDHEQGIRGRDLRKLCESFGFGIPEIVASLPDNQLVYYDRMLLVQRATWSQGRCVLLGDAAHCTSPLSTKGAATGLAGAYILAKELAIQSSFQAACASYENRLRPGVERIQKRTQQNVRRMLASNERDAVWRNRILRLIPSGVMRSMMVKSQSDAIVSAL